MEIDKKYDHLSIEKKWYTFWEEKGFFKADPSSKKPPYTIVLPPPNVTGVLHMGHAVMVVVQDAMSRYKRMSGYDVLWLPGTDHAGIATQMVVERALNKEGISRHDLGREKFLERVWKWKKENGSTITRQLRCLEILENFFAVSDVKKFSHSIYEKSCYFLRMTINSNFFDFLICIKRCNYERV